MLVDRFVTDFVQKRFGYNY